LQQAASDSKQALSVFLPGFFRSNQQLNLHYARLSKLCTTPLQASMSLFNASSFSLGSGGKQLDPAAEISRLLNQHSHHWQTLGAMCKQA
jgi:hypothetical protein